MTDLDCSTRHTAIHGYLDHALEPAAAAEMADHLQRCAACRGVYAQARLLSVSVKRHASYYPAPDLLVRNVFAPAPTARRHRWALLRNGLAPVFCATALGLALVLYVATPSADKPWMEDAVASHVRALMAAHLNDVVSSDRHTVKPWFSGKLDFSPPVEDLAAQGFPLLGGRLDYLQNQPTAALSYGRAKHVINLFILPSATADAPREAVSLRGYNLVAWQRGHMRFIAVSDVEAAELQTFSRLIEQGL